jgi:uncharacterized membrane protein YhaH (DUF805 family)
MGFGEAVSTCFRKYATFQGRARRSEFWYYYLFIIIVNAVLSSLLYTAILTGPSREEIVDGVKQTVPDGLSAFGLIMVVVVSIWALAILLPTLSVMVRRLHDADHSGWWWWINLVCFGWIVLLIFWVSEGTRGPNRFGPDPKA